MNWFNYIKVRHRTIGWVRICGQALKSFCSECNFIDAGDIQMDYLQITLPVPPIEIDFYTPWQAGQTTLTMVIIPVSSDQGLSNIFLY